MKKLTIIQTIRFSEDDIQLMKKLKDFRIRPDEFIRIAFREKLKRDLPKLIEQENKLNSKDYCPF